MPRFSLRDLLWLTLVVACLTAWWVDREGLVGRLRRKPVELIVNGGISAPDGRTLIEDARNKRLTVEWDSRGKRIFLG